MCCFIDHAEYKRDMIVATAMENKPSSNILRKLSYKSSA